MSWPLRWPPTPPPTPPPRMPAPRALRPRSYRNPWAPHVDRHDDHSRHARSPDCHRLLRVCLSRSGRVVQGHRPPPQPTWTWTLPPRPPAIWTPRPSVGRKSDLPSATPGHIIPSQGGGADKGIPSAHPRRWTCTPLAVTDRPPNHLTCGPLAITIAAQGTVQLNRRRWQQGREGGKGRWGRGSKRWKDPMTLIR